MLLSLVGPLPPFLLSLACITRDDNQCSAHALHVTHDRDDVRGQLPLMTHDKDALRSWTPTTIYGNAVRS